MIMNVTRFLIDCDKNLDHLNATISQSNQNNYLRFAHLPFIVQCEVKVLNHKV